MTANVQPSATRLTLKKYVPPASALQIIFVAIIGEDGGPTSPFYVRKPNGTIINCSLALIGNSRNDCIKKAIGLFKAEPNQPKFRIISGITSDLKVFSRAGKVCTADELAAAKKMVGSSRWSANRLRHQTKRVKNPTKIYGLI